MRLRSHGLSLLVASTTDQRCVSLTPRRNGAFERLGVAGNEGIEVHRSKQSGEERADTHLVKPEVYSALGVITSPVAGFTGARMSNNANTQVIDNHSSASARNRPGHILQQSVRRQ